MHLIEETITINTPIEHVWTMLLDFNAYSEWNPFITSIRGEAVQGRKLTAFIEPPNRKGMTFTPTVLKCDAPHELRWRGKLFIKGLFDGEHYFLLKALDGHRTQFLQGEQFTGILVAPFKSALSDTQKGFQTMNEALKRRCEAPYSEQH